MPAIAPVVAAIGSAVSSIGAAVAAFGATTLGATILQTASVFALNAAISAFTPKPKAQVAERQASVLELSLGEVPREAVFGRAMLGGSLIDAFNYGEDNTWEALVIALADHEIDGLEGFYVNDKYYSFTGDGFVPEFYELTAPSLEIVFRNGAPGQVVAPRLRASAPDRWGPNDHLTGVAYVVVSYRYSEKVWPGGRPSFLWGVRGAKCYDPRKDSTVSGGSGAHRWGVQSTYEWSENAAICRYNFVRGVYSNGQLMVGPGRTAEEAPPEDIIAAANLCDEDVALRWPTTFGETTEKRYRCSAVVRADESWIDVEENFAAAMAGQIVDRAGSVFIEPGAAKTPISYGEDWTFTDDDLIRGAEKRWQAKLSRDQLVNTVTATFIDPGQMWRPTAVPVRRSLEDIAADREPREQSLQLAYVHSRSQAQRLSEIERRKARFMGTATVTLGAKFIGLEPGDWITWKSKRRFAASPGQMRTFHITNVGITKECRVTLSLREIGATVFGWNAPLDEIDPQAPVYLPSASPSAAQIRNFEVAAIAIPGAGNLNYPAIAATWTPPADPSITGIELEYRKVGALASDFWSVTDPSRGVATISSGLELGDYEVRAIPVAPGREANATAWRPVSLTGALTNPVAPDNFSGYQTGDQIRFVWSGSLDPTMRYEIRAGLSWELGRRVERTLGSSTNATWPILEDEDALFWIKALDSSGEYSPTAAFWNARVVVQPDRNTIVTQNFSNDGWPGAKHDMTIDGAYLALDTVGGTSRLRGDYYQQIDLPAQASARTWISQRANVFQSDTPEWEDAELAWEQVGDATWEPDFDESAADLETYIAVDQELDGTLLEGFRFNGSLLGAVADTDATLIEGATFAPGKMADGVTVSAAGNLSYDLEVGVAFSALFDLRVTEAPEADCSIKTFSTAAGDFLEVWYRASDGALVLSASDGPDLILPAVFEAGDTLSIGVWQSESGRGMTSASRRYPTPLVGSVETNAALVFAHFKVMGPAIDGITVDDFDTAELTVDDCADMIVNTATAIGVWRENFPGVVSDLAIYGNAAQGAGFASNWNVRGPIGYGPFQLFNAGDRTLQSVVIWMIVRAPAPISQISEITRAIVYFDVPDRIDRAKGIEIDSGGTHISFTRDFFLTPAIVAEWSGGAVFAKTKITNQSASGFDVQLFSLIDPDTPVAGFVDWIAAGW